MTGTLAAGWTFYTGGTHYQAKSIDFTRQVDSLDSAILDLGEKIPINTIGSVCFNSEAVMIGYVGSCNRTSKKTYSTMIVEQALELKTQLARTSTGGINVTVSNAGGTKTIHDYIVAILGIGDATYGSGYTDGTGSTSTVIPGTSTPLPTMQFTSMYRMAALDKFLKNTCGYMYWFDYSSKTIYYGEQRVDHTGDDLQAIDVKDKENNVITEYTEVVIYGKNTLSKGVATTGSPPYKTIQYQYTDYADTTELTRIAEQILRDKSPQGLRYEVDMTIQQAILLSLSPGDLVTVSDPFESLSDTGIIRDIKYRGDIAVIGVGDKEVSAFDLLDEKLRLIEGVSTVATTYAWDGGWQNVGPLATAHWKFTIDDIDSVLSFNLSMHLDKFKKFMSIDDAMSGIDTTNTAYTGLDDTHSRLTGMNNTNSALLGLTTSNSAYTGLSACNILNSVSAHYTAVVENNAVSISLTMSTFVVVTADINISAMAKGYHFGIAYLEMVIEDSGGAGIAGFVAKVYKSVGTSPGYVSFPTVAYYYCPGGSPARYNLTFVTILLGDTCSTGTRYRWAVSAGQNNCVCRAYGAYVSLVPRHDHGITDLTHSNSITDKYQTHNLTDPTHMHLITDVTHPHNITDQNHEHNENDTLTDYDSYPSTIYVIVNGSVVYSGPGGGIATIDIGEIVEHLVEGENDISITSATAGSVFLMGDVSMTGEVT